jgi:hypothetical protein
MSNESKRTEFNKEWGFAFSHPYFEVAVCGAYNLGEVGLAVLSLIVKMYTRNVAIDKACEKDVAVYYSYDDIAKRTQRSKNGVIKAFKILLDEELIERTNNGVRSGRGKYGYMPNHTKLNEILKEYLDGFPEDKTCNILP